MRPIDADALKDKLQQHHDFWVMAWGGFGKMPIGEKKRVDEITNCIAEVVNFPTIEPKRGEWTKEKRVYGISKPFCSRCGAVALSEMINLGSYKTCESNFCPNCGCAMTKE